MCYTCGKLLLLWTEHSHKKKTTQDLGKEDTGRSFTPWMTPYLLCLALGKANKLFDLIFLTFKVGEFNTCSED